MYEELKKLAKACRQDKWLSKTSSEDPDEGAIVYIEIPNASPNAISVLFDADWATDAETDFVAAANPSAVLALIAENERFERETKRVNASWHGMKRDLDKLKAEDARSTEREILQLAEIESLRKVIKDVWLTTPGQAGAGDISRLQRTYADVGRIVLGMSKDADQ